MRRVQKNANLQKNKKVHVNDTISFDSNPTKSSPMLWKLSLEAYLLSQSNVIIGTIRNLMEVLIFEEYSAMDNGKPTFSPLHEIFQLNRICFL